MRMLLPEAGDEALDELYLDIDLRTGTDRPGVSLGMVSSVDGAATVGGHTAALGGEADRLAFRRLREACDVILVGAGTARIERYGPPRDRPGVAERRVARGLAPLPRLAVLSASLDFDADARLFDDPERPPLVITVGDADPDRRRALDGRAEMVAAGRGRVSPARLLEVLGDQGLPRVLCEGGPTLAGELLAADLIDEIFLTVAPVLAGDAAPRIVTGMPGITPRHLALSELREHDGELLLRYSRTDLPPVGRDPG